MKKEMFKIKRISAGGENVFRIATDDGTIEIRGRDTFVVRMVKSLCEESSEFLEILRDNLAGEMHETIAAKMRRAGFDEDIVKDFENDSFWDDIIFD